VNAASYSANLFREVGRAPGPSEKNLMVLLLSLVLALIPLLVLRGSSFMVRHDGGWTVYVIDPVAMSGILGMNVMLEVRKRHGLPRKVACSTARTTRDGLVQSGKVESVQFFESNVESRTSRVTLSNGAKSSNMLILEGDMRNALPVGQKVEVTFRKHSDTTYC